MILKFDDRGLNRRVFIKTLGVVTAALFTDILGGCEGCIDRIRNRPVRRRLRSGSAQVDAAVATYAEAVRLMKALPPTDPRSWSSQAAIHGVFPSGFNHCQHGTNHFFSWHRAYLFFFEKICQELTGDGAFGLPYWNWNQNPDIHPAFLDNTSALFDARNRDSVAGLSAVSTADLDTIFSDYNFFTFSQQIEGTPHNMVHGFVGGDMASFGSALDPIFWTHHCMVDYCWAKWNMELGNDNTNDATWIGESWDHFVDGSGNPASMTAGATILMPLLSYQYESSRVGSQPGSMEAKIKADYAGLEKRLRAGADIRFELRDRVRIAPRAEIAVGRPFSGGIDAAPARFAQLLERGAGAERIFARVAFAHLPPVSDFFVRVFVNLPAAAGDTPIDDPHYAGSFAFFGTHVADGRHEGRNFLVDVTHTLQKLRATQRLGAHDPLSIQLVAVPAFDHFSRADAVLHLAGIELIVTPITVEAHEQNS